MVGCDSDSTYCVSISVSSVNPANFDGGFLISGQKMNFTGDQRVWYHSIGNFVLITNMYIVWGVMWKHAHFSADQKDNLEKKI